MARETFEDWIPVELGSDVLQEIARVSVTESEAHEEPMASDTKQIPRSGEFAIAAVAKGAAYGETAGTNDYVELIARKAGGVVRIAEEDLTDTVTAERTLAVKRVDAARNMAKFFDNATLATTAAANGTTVLYTSVYRSVRTNDSATGYTADTNYTSGAVTYDLLSSWLADAEESVHFDDSQAFIAMHPAFRAAFRGLKDSQNNPIFVDPQGSTSSPPTLWGYRVRYSFGLKTSATNTTSPSGNPLMIMCNKRLMLKGMARLSNQIASTNPGFAIQRAASGVGFLTDETLMKAAMRRAFAIGYPQAFSVFEKTS